MNVYSTYKNNESPLNYSGGKFKILDFIQNNLPEKINTFIDLFGGGFNVGSNIINSKKIIYNDYNFYTKELVEKLYNSNYNDIINQINNIIKNFDLEYGSENYYKLRNYYNSMSIDNRDPMYLYTLILYGFQHQIRFNKKHQFNNPVGRSGLNDSIRNKIKNFGNFNNKIVDFESKDFRNFYNYEYKKDDFVYCDPPYLITSASYNDGNKRGFDGWDEKIEKDFLDFLSYLNSNNIKFMLSNVIEHKGKRNRILENWVLSNKLNILSYKSKRKEIIVKNY